MNSVTFTFQNQELCALGSGALFWPAQNLLVVSDLHLGKSARVARFGGAQLPPYETTDTLIRLRSDLTATRATSVVCLGDSFDTPSIQHTLPEADLLALASLQAGRDWTWVEGNHDPGPVALGGVHRAEVTLGDLQFRHIAKSGAQSGEVSGHYHPKATLVLRGRQLTRPCFLYDANRIIMPAYGTFTGGLHCHDTALCAMMTSSAKAILTGARPVEIPMPRRAA